MFTVGVIAFSYVLSWAVLIPPLAHAQPRLRWRKPSRKKLGVCEGDCDTDKDCQPPLRCFQRTQKHVPGCLGSGNAWRDFCIRPGKMPGYSKGKPQSTPVQSVEKIRHVGTTSSYVTGSNVYKAKIKIPEGTQAGDLLLLVLHRTDDYLPLAINDSGGWTRACECYKTGNGKDCSTYLDCMVCAPKDELVGTKNVFCEKFGGGGQLGKKTEGRGRDLAQSIFYKEAGTAELRGSTSLSFVLSPWESREDPAWMFLSAFRGADTKDPIRDWNGTGNDNSTHSVFPAVYGKEGDLMILSQGFDSGAPGVKEGDFLPPKGFVNYVSMFDCGNPLSRKSKRYGCDESGYLFGKVLNEDGDTGSRAAQGNGSAVKGDSLLSMTIIPKGGSRDRNGRGASEYLGNANGKNCPKAKSTPKP